MIWQMDRVVALYLARATIICVGRDQGVSFWGVRPLIPTIAFSIRIDECHHVKISPLKYA